VAAIKRLNRVPELSHIDPFGSLVCKTTNLVAFLQSLTDEALLHDVRFANPWPATPRP
jgi:hypothetical protein